MIELAQDLAGPFPFAAVERPDRSLLLSDLRAVKAVALWRNAFRAQVKAMSNLTLRAQIFASSGRVIASGPRLAGAHAIW